MTERLSSIRAAAMAGLLLLLAVALGPKEARAEGEDSPAAWSPDLTTQQGSLDFLRGLLQLYPDLPLSRFKYEFDLLNAARRVPELREELGENAAPERLEEGRYLAVEYSEGQPWKVNEPGVEKAKASLAEAVDAVSLSDLKGLAEDIRSLQGKRGTDKPVLALLPLLYHEDGTPRHRKLTPSVRKKIKEQINGLTPEQLELEYRAPLYRSFLGLAADAYATSNPSQREKRVETLRNQFNALPGVNALKPVGADGNAVPTRFISLEELPPEVALYRPYFTFDCSGCSSRNYPLGDEVKAYAVRKTRNRSAFPNGYMLVREFPDPENGAKTVHVLGLSGEDMAPSDVEHAIKLATYSARATQRMLPDHDEERSPHSENLREGLRRLESGTESWDSGLPEWWEKIEAFSRKLSDHDIRDWFERDATENVLGRNVEPGEKDPHWGVPVEEKGPFREPPREKLSEVPAFNRTVMAAKILQYYKFQPKLTRAVLDTFQVTKAQLDAVNPFVRANWENIPTVEDYRLLRKTFKVPLASLRGLLDTYLLGETLSRFYESAPDLAPEKDWEREFRRMNGRLRRDLEMWREGHVVLMDRILPKGRKVEHVISDLLVRIPKPFNDLKLSDITGSRDHLERSTRSAFDRLELAIDVIDSHHSASKSNPTLPFASEENRRNAALRLLNLTPEVLEAGRTMQEFREGDLPPPERLTEVLRRVNLTLMDLTMYFDAFRAAEIATHLFEQDASLLEPEQWRRLFAEINRALKLELRNPDGSNHPSNPDRLGGHFREQLTLPEPFVTVDYVRAAREGTNEGVRELIRQVARRERWHGNIWDMVTLIFEDGDILERTGEQNSLIRELIRALQHKPWPESFFRELGDNLRDYAKESGDREFNHFWRNETWDMDLIQSARAQKLWPRHFWEAVTEALENSRSEVLREDLIELLLSREQWPADLRDRLRRALRGERNAELTAHLLRVRTAGEPTMAFGPSCGGTYGKVAQQHRP